MAGVGEVQAGRKFRGRVQLEVASVGGCMGQRARGLWGWLWHEHVVACNQLVLCVCVHGRRKQVMSLACGGTNLGLCRREKTGPWQVGFHCCMGCMHVMKRRENCWWAVREKGSSAGFAGLCSYLGQTYWAGIGPWNEPKCEQVGLQKWVRIGPPNGPIWALSPSNKIK